MFVDRLGRGMWNFEGGGVDLEFWFRAKVVVLEDISPFRFSRVDKRCVGRWLT